jgi:2-C-methyl-D-erythritol 4-phosphate cytidylyltransferase
MKNRQYTTLADVRHNVPLVARIYDQFNQAEAAERSVIALATANEALFARVMELEQIAPKKITAGGQTFIWHCPDELVPESPR